MKWVKFVFRTSLVLILSMNLAAWAQEAAQPQLTQFDLAENPAIDQHIVDLLGSNVSVLNRPDAKIDPSELRLLRFSIRREIAGILATEGYFSPAIKFEVEDSGTKKIVHIKIELGDPTKVASVKINFEGSTLPAELQQSVQSGWGLKAGQIFTENAWSEAKAKIIELLNEQSYAIAKMTDSEAVIQDQQANLSITIDSGPIFYIGELNVIGLKLYKPWIVARYHPPVKGEAYNRVRLLKFQSELQNSPYFSSVTVNVDPKPDNASAMPIDVLVTERKEYDVGIGAGFSTNTGARGELSFQDRNFVGDAYNLKSGIRIEQRRQVGYADIYLPPKPSGYLDSVGLLSDRSDIAGLVTQTTSFGAKRIITENSVERRMGLAFVFEDSSVDGGAVTHAKALIPSIGRTWRYVDNIFDPRRGRILQADLSGATKLTLSDQNFLRLYGKYQQWIPVGKRDVIILRGEAGYVVARNSDGIPEDYLFRAGGTGSVRGYLYQSLGVSEADGTVGGLMLTTASAEYVHWLSNTWGVAGFVDVGDAADHFSELHIKQSVGVGARYKTPAGPIAVDLAYGRQVKKFRLDFSIGIAF